MENATKLFFFFFQAEDGIRDSSVTGVQTCALPISQQMADKAWSIIEQAESMGGMTRAVATGWAKLQIERCAAEKQARIDRGEDVIVGVNKYRLAEEERIEIRDIDNSAV